ncbi:hypothetical protein [Nocardia sp. XZ_19_369]|uniref:hypothetical protein n=1 Tax=Nocardia sp. XZ_19_369 TaxID=2769487 RepID=UPI001890178D|nr:hypothetical protein [Nocardia sp. XZ_19_369]
MIRVDHAQLAGLSRSQAASLVRRRIAEESSPDPLPPKVALPTIEPLAAMIPGGLWRGALVDYRGATQPLLGIVAAASAAGLWAGMVNPSGRRDVQASLLAVHEMAGDLARVPVVTAPDEELVPTIRALLDGMHLVVAGLGQASVAPGMARILATQARKRQCTLVLAGGRRRCEGADIRLAARVSGAEGLSLGRGRLKSLRYNVIASVDGKTVHGEIQASSRAGRLEWADVTPEARTHVVPLRTGTS